MYHSSWMDTKRTWIKCCFWENHKLLKVKTVFRIVAIISRCIPLRGIILYDLSHNVEYLLEFKKFVIGSYFSGRRANNGVKIHQICKGVSNNIDGLYIYLREEFTPCQRFSEKEIGNLREILPAFVNPSRRFQESPSGFGIIGFETLSYCVMRF